MKNFTFYFARPLVIVSLYLFVCLSSISAQINYNYPIPGPYEDYHGPYFIRVQVNFLQPTNDLWTNNWDVQAEANAVMATLNSAFNKHRIYFVPYTNPCSGSAFQVFTTNLNTLEVRDQLQAPATINEAYHIYVIHDIGGIGGWEFNTPNNFCQIYGKRNGVLVTRSEILVHEVGHNLGLVHTFTGLSNEGCDETPGSCSPNSPCDCCGDYVCDTQPHSNSSINASVSCSHPSLPEHIVRNFMSNTNPGDCRNQFTSEQAKRMRTYLELAPVLQSAQIKTTNYPGTIPSSFSGNIIVHSGELLVNSQINMLPGSTIRVKRGAKLRISSTITAACNGMWQGVIVEGSTFATQTAANQGSVVISTNGKIEHAKIAIDVQDSDPISKPIPSSGGGIVTVVGGQFVNNTIGIRFGAYATPGTGAANSSLLVSGRFSITDEYRDGNNKTTFLDLTGIVRLRIIGGRFQDLRTQCTDTSNRALGIDSILYWLALLQTYQTDLQLAKHHFFTGNSAEFVQIWHRLETEHDLTGEQEAELNRLGEVFDMLENELSQGFTLNNLPESSIENLILKTQICDEAAFLSEILLWRNGIRIETTCNGGEERTKPDEQVISQNDNSVQLFPNPAANQLTVQFKKGTTGRVQIHNQIGRIVYSTSILDTNESVIINTLPFPNGIYFVAFRLHDSLPKSRKLIIQH